MSLKKFHKLVKRGDTLIEVMIAIAIFTFVTVLTVAMMNTGLASAERSLEVVTARNELNAQAEALRFIHSSYASELTLPECRPGLGANEKCQKFRKLWETIVGRALDHGDPTIEYPVMNCPSVYEDGTGTIYRDRAFVINTRLLEATNADTNVISGTELAERLARAYIQAKPDEDIFRAPTLNSRIIFTRDAGGESDDQLSDVVESGAALTVYNKIKYVEGIWVVAVKSQDTTRGEPDYYDFYIETCWHGSGNNAPTSLDTVIRLYNPDARS